MKKVKVTFTVRRVAIIEFPEEEFPDGQDNLYDAAMANIDECSGTDIGLEVESVENVK